MKEITRWAWLACAAVVLPGCTREARDVGPSQPRSAPSGPADQRIGWYQDNVSQVSQGGRYFSWYGCTGCHGENAARVLNLADGVWKDGGAFDQVYRSVAGGHGRLDYANRIPAEQLWQLTAYVRDLPSHTPEKNRRVDADAKGEPQGAQWSGPLR